MTAPALGGIAAIAAQSAPLVATRAPAAASPGAGFGGLVAQDLEQVNRQLVASQVDLQQMAVGRMDHLHQAMIRLEESRLGFQLAMQVRNRVLEAYQDVMKMPV